MTMFIFGLGCAHPQKSESPPDLATGKEAIQRMAGCYLVDYNYVETEILKPGYKRDPRVYDVNKTKAVKEWIYSDEISPRRIRLQHILFATDLAGNLVPGSELKHQAEDWEYEAPYLYEYQGESKWMPKPLAGTPGAWVRRVTNLDDGLRYQCSAPWNGKSAYPEWSCDNYAPIPGRETRDMGRKDYNGLQRSTRIIVYRDNWLERQDNTKIVQKGDRRVPLTKEAGKNWYVRLPDAECAAMQDFVKERREFWALLRESWDDVFKASKPFAEKSTKPPRFVKMMKIEDEYQKRDLRDPGVRQKARDEILKTIDDYREKEPVVQASGSGR